MTTTQLHSVMDLLAEAKRLMHAEEMHVQFLHCPRDTAAVMLMDDGRIADDRKGETCIEMERAGDNIAVEATTAKPPRRPK